MQKIYKIIIAVFFVFDSLFAQGTYLTLEGNVKDNDGTALIGATISVTEVGGSLVRGATSDANGKFRVLGIPPGMYKIKVSMIGYRTSERQNIRFITGQKPTVNFTLVQENVEISGVEVVGSQISNFELKRTDVSTAVISDQIQNLPLNSRNVMNLASVVPGVRTFTEVGGRSMPSAGSLPDLRFVNFYVDGTEWKNLFNGNIAGLGQTGSVLPQDGVQEFRFVLSPFDAEYTRGGAYIINTITRKGSNEFGANAFILHRDKGLNTKLPNEKTKSPFKRQQYGIDVKGPIVHDKFFYSVAFERHVTDNIYTVTPGKPAYNPGIWDSYAKTYTAPIENITGLLRLTYVVDENQNLDYIWSSRKYDAIGFFGGINDISNAVHSLFDVNSHMLKHTYVVSPSSFNELSFHYLRWRHDEPAYEDRPMYAYPSLLLGNSGFPISIYEDHYRFVNKFTTQLTDFHTLKAGVEGTIVEFKPWFPGSLNPRFNFATDSSQLPYSASIGVGIYNPTNSRAIDAETNDVGYLLGFFIQDQWNVTDKLTLNFGLRYDAEINTLNNSNKVAWADSTDLKSLLDSKYLNTGNRKNDLDNIAPRFSFTYDVDGSGRTIVRGGAGRSFDRVASYFSYFERRDASWRQYQFTFNNTTNPSTLDPNILRQRVAAGNIAGVAPAMNLLPNEIATPEIDQFSAGIAHQFNDEFGTSLDFVYQSMSNIYTSRNFNYLNKAVSPSARVLSPKYGDIQIWSDSAKANNLLLLVSTNYKTENLNLTGSYTFNTANSWYDGNPAQNRPTNSSFTMFRSNGEEKHRFVFSGLTKLPFGIKFSTLLTLASPRPFDVTDGRDLNLNNTTADDFPNSERNQLPEDSFRNWYKMLDLRLSYTLEMSQFGVNIPKTEFIFDVFNAANWVNVSSFNGRKYDNSGNLLTTFGTETGYYHGRQLQLGLRIQY